MRLLLQMHTGASGRIQWNDLCTAVMLTVATITVAICCCYGGRVHSVRRTVTALCLSVRPPVSSFSNVNAVIRACSLSDSSRDNRPLPAMNAASVRFGPFVRESVTCSLSEIITHKLIYTKHSIYTCSSYANSSEDGGGSVAAWLACWTQAQKGLSSNRSRDAVG